MGKRFIMFCHIGLCCHSFWLVSRANTSGVLDYDSPTRLATNRSIAPLWHIFRPSTSNSGIMPNNVSEKKKTIFTSQSPTDAILIKPVWIDCYLRLFRSVLTWLELCPVAFYPVVFEVDVIHFEHVPGDFSTPASVEVRQLVGRHDHSVVLQQVRELDRWSVCKYGNAASV